MEANVDVNQINSDFQVFFRPQNYYHYCSYAIQCGCKFRSIAIFKYFLDHNVIIIIVFMESIVNFNQINTAFQVFLDYNVIIIIVFM